MTYIPTGGHYVKEASAISRWPVMCALTKLRNGCNPAESHLSKISLPSDFGKHAHLGFESKHMQRRFLVVLRSFSSIAFLATLLVSPLASAQSPAAPAAPAEHLAEPAVDDAASRVLHDGKVFEDSQRWGEALAHYDAALREHPDSKTIRSRRTLAHIHVDVDRRCVDSSYLRYLNSTSQTDVLNTYQEICLKVQSHYVHEPNWLRLAWRGTANLDVAVTKPSFQKLYLTGVPQEKIAAFRNQLRSDVNRRPVRSRSDARGIAMYTAKLANEELGISPSVTIGEYCAGAIASLDQYSSYLTEAQLDDVYGQIEGNFVGLGIELKASDDALLIVKVIPGGPAESNGIRAGDRIVAVEGHATSEMSTEKAADLLKGEHGSYVSVSIADRSNTTRDLRIRRERVDVPCVEDIGIIDEENGIGYFRLTSFQKSTSRDVDQALWQLHRKGMRSLIVDVRGNPGGLLTASVEVADKFVQEGTLVSTSGRSPRENSNYKAHRVGTWRVPLIVLIDGDTASASEIFAGAIRDHGRGTVLGERSYGKGSVQGIFPLSMSRSGVRLTTAKFYSPSGQAISERGVTPHRVVKTTAAKLNSDTFSADIVPTGMPSEKDDAVVGAACEIARKLVVANRSN